MAESVVNSISSRFFCHKCDQEIDAVSPDFSCPTCKTGFIEELTNDSSGSEDHVIAHIVTGTIPENERTTSGRSDGNRSINEGEMPEPNVFQFEYQSFDQVQRIQSHLQEIFSVMTQNVDLQLPFLLHGNLGDYAWGSGFDAVITQILNSVEVSGPPPLPREEIEQLATVEVKQSDVDRHLQCTVCMEDYKANESVKKLSCDHMYHRDCIVPWLKMHATCPICRQFVNSKTSEGINENDGISSQSNDSPNGNEL